MKILRKMHRHYPVKNLLFTLLLSLTVLNITTSVCAAAITAKGHLSSEVFSEGIAVVVGNAVSPELTGEPKCTGLPIVVTKPATDITSHCATLKGSVHPQSGSTTYWFDWGSSTAYGNTTTPKIATGASYVNVFSYISGLVAGTTYHFRLVATNSLGTSYGNDTSFVAGSVTLTTNPVTSITSFNAISGGNITANGGFAVTARGVCWSTSPSPTIADTYTSDGSGNGAFTSLMNLNQGETYYVRAYATNSIGTFYGNEYQFTTNIYCTRTLPYDESFSEVVIPECWSQTDYQGNGQLWQFGTIDNQTPAPIMEGNYAFLNSNNFGTGDTQNAELISPGFNLFQTYGVRVQFKHFFFNSTSSTATLSYATMIGSDEWTVLQTFSATSSSNPEIIVFELTEEFSDIYFKWTYTGSYGSYWAIDDVQITAIPAPVYFGIGPENRDVPAYAGETFFDVTSNTTYSSSSDQPWCVVAPSGSYDEDIVVNYSVNTTGQPRIANITVTPVGADPVVVTVTQEAPVISITPLVRNVSYTAGNTSFTITSNASWTASSDQSWCTVTPTGTGNGDIAVSYTLNPDITSRTATITVAVPGLEPGLLSVIQEGSIPFLEVSPLIKNVGTSSGFSIFDVTSTVNWNVTSDQPWCTATPSGSGNGTITAVFEENNTNASRTALLTVSGSGVDPVVVTINQAFQSGSDDFLLSARNLEQTSPNTLEFDVYLLNTNPSQPFELAGLQFGLFLNSSIYTGGVLTASYNNTGSGLIPLQQFSANTSIVEFATGVYADHTLIRLASRMPVGYGNGSIISTADYGTLVTHFIITSSVPFTENSTANFTFLSNTVTVPLYATRVSAYVNGTNTQLPVIPGVNAIIPENPVLNGPPELEVVPGSQTVEPEAGNVGFAINANTAWEASTDQSWVTITPSGFGNGTILATYDPNITEPRSAVITISSPGLEDTQVTLSQEAMPVRTLSLSLLIEGLYNGNGTLRQVNDAEGPRFDGGVSDLISIELHNSSDFGHIEYVADNIELGTNGVATVNIPQTFTGSYYVTIRHRNSVETTSVTPVSFAAEYVSYAFNQPEKAFGGNLALIDGHYAIRSGDINQDGTVDTADMTLVDNSSADYDSGYIAPDVNGDGVADTADMTLVDNNSAAYVTAITP
ncbi:MAG: hypothetical protein JNL22_12835 [Bacteroidales bacterium]|nr:hypothetical protein [Bacteroidales bacterium]